MIFPLHDNPGSTSDAPLGVVLVGASGVGKSLGAKMIEATDDTFRTLPQHMTRRARTNELHGFDGYFVTDEEFDRLESDGEFEIALRDPVTDARLGIARTLLDQFANRGVSPILGVRNLHDGRALVRALEEKGFSPCVVYVYMREELRRSVLALAGALDDFHRELSLDRDSKLGDLNACYEGSDMFIVNDGVLDSFHAQILRVVDHCRGRRALDHGRMPSGLDREALRSIEEDWRDLQRWSRGSMHRSTQPLHASR